MHLQLLAAAAVASVGCGFAPAPTAAAGRSRVRARAVIGYTANLGLDRALSEEELAAILGALPGTPAKRSSDLCKLDMYASAEELAKWSTRSSFMEYMRPKAKAADDVALDAVYDALGGGANFVIEEKLLETTGRWLPPGGPPDVSALVRDVVLGRASVLSGYVLLGSIASVAAYALVLLPLLRKFGLADFPVVF